MATKKLVRKVRRTIFEISDRSSSNYQIISLIATRLSKENRNVDFVVYSDHNGHFIMDAEIPADKVNETYVNFLKEMAKVYKTVLDMFFKKV